MIKSFDPNFAMRSPSFWANVLVTLIQMESFIISNLPKGS